MKKRTRIVDKFTGHIYAPTPTPTPTPAPTPTPTPQPTPEPTPAPTPPPPSLPRFPITRLDLKQLWAGQTYTSDLKVAPSPRIASKSRLDPLSYTVDVKVHVQRPHAATTLEELKIPDASIGTILSKIKDFPAAATVSPLYDKIYDNKEAHMRRRLERLDLLLSRHNYYDCDTILDYTAPGTGRKMLLFKGGMDVNTDGVDPDRNYDVDTSPIYFQPQTTYRWKRKTSRSSPVVEKIRARLTKAKKDLATPRLAADKAKELRDLVKKYEGQISDLRHWSFLISAADPSIVVPGFMLQPDGDKPAPVKVGDYAVVIAKGKLYPCIVGDAGPNSKWGEASLRICKAINPRSSANWRAASDLDVAFLVFPDTAEPADVPNYDRWRSRCAALLAEIGYPDAPLERWENIVPPWPEEVKKEPTPEPTAPATPTDPVPPENPEAANSE